MASGSASTTRRVRGAGLLWPRPTADGAGTIWTAVATVSTETQAARATILGRLVPGRVLDYPGAAGRDFCPDWSRYRQIWQLQQNTGRAEFCWWNPSDRPGYT